VARANIPHPPLFPSPIKKALDKIYKLKIKEYLCQVSSKSLENCYLCLRLSEVSEDPLYENSVENRLRKTICGSGILA